MQEDKGNEEREGEVDGEQQTRTTPTTEKRHYEQTSSGHSRVFSCCSRECSHASGFAATLNMLLCLSLCIRFITSSVVSCSHRFTYSLVCAFFEDFADPDTWKTGLFEVLTLHTPSVAVDRRQL